MPNEQKQLILRYAQIVLSQEVKNDQSEIDAKLTMEMDSIRKTLGMEHVAILELAAKNVIDEFDC